MTSGETGKGSQTRALLFDISFLMLCHITQLYGPEVVVSSQECMSSFFVQWVVRCLPEDGKYKSVDLMSPPEPNKLDVVLVQLNSGGELKTNLTRWQDVCHNAPYAIQEVLMAWESGAINEDTVKTIMENTKSVMCCLPIVVSTWLCSYINVCNVECRQKALFMLQHLLTPLASETSQAYYAERSNLMQVILGKIVHELLPSESIPRLNPTAFLLPAKTATREILIETFQRISNRGCIDIDDLHKMNYMLGIGGPQWFCENLVRDVLRHDRPEDLHKGVSLLYSLFHLDLENLTICLLHHTLPSLLQSTGPNVRLLIDPRGSSLAKLCVMCLAVLHAMRQQPKESVNAPRGRKRTRDDLRLEDEEDIAEEERPTKLEKLDLSDSVSLCNDVFSLGEFLPCGGKDDDTENSTAMLYDSKDLLNRTLVNLFRLFYGILVDKLISPRSNFVNSFIVEMLKTGQGTTRFIFQFMLPNMVNLLVKSLGDVLIQLSDLTTQSGRRAAARVVCQAVRFQVQTDAVTLPA